MPVRPGPHRMPARCIHSDAEDNTDDPGVMTRDGLCCDPWMSENPFIEFKECAPKYKKTVTVD